jgi:hypothetical protein
VLAAIQTSNDRQNVAVDLPSRAAPGAVVVLDLSNTFVPGPHDKRSLGVVIDDVGLTPVSGHFRPSGYVMARAGLAILACIAGLLLCGLRSRLAVVVSAAVAVGFTWLLLQDGAFIGTYVDRLPNIGFGVALTGAVIAATRWRWPNIGELPEWSIAAGLVLAATAVELALFAHPLATVGDGIFQVHRAALVHSGTYFFTSVTPKPFFEFPYPVALYVTAQPFWHFFPTELDLVRLLRGLSVGADALVGVGLYAAARRQWNDRRTALLCAVLWPFARAPLQALSNANLTNAFGQAIFGVAMGAIAWNAAGRRTSVTALVAAAGFLVVAFLSHFGTVSVGVPIFCAVGVLLVAAGQAHVRRSGVWVLVVVLAAAAVSYGIYYSHFNPIYRATLARVVSREAEAPARSKVVAPPAVKLQRWIDGTSDDYGLPGLPVLAAAAGGLFLLLKRRLREGFTLVLSAWVLAWACLTALEIFTPIEMRVTLAAAPVFVCLGAYALGALAGRSRLGATLAIGGALLLAWDGLRVCLTCIGVVPRW